MQRIKRLMGADDLNAKEIEDDWWFEELMYECLFYTSHVRP